MTDSAPPKTSAVIALILLAAIGGLMQAARSLAIDTTAGTELAFGYLLLVAYFTAKTIDGLGLPKLTGYFLAGVVSGPAVLGLVDTGMTATLDIVSNAATAILALEAGAELDLKRVRPLMKTLRGITIYAVVGAMITLTGLLFLLRPWIDLFDGMTATESLVVCAVMGIAMSSQSPSVAMAMLAETRAEGPLARIVLASNVVADLTVIIVFSIALAVAGGIVGGGVDVTATALEVAWELLGSIAFGVAIGMVLGVFLRTVKSGAVLFALLVCVIVAEIGSRIHLDPLIVLLSSGVWIRNFSKANVHDLLGKFEQAQLPVFLVFFALAGNKLRIQELADKIGIVAAIATTRAVTFFLGARFACKRSGAEPVVTRYAWVGLCPQAGLALALATVLSNAFSSPTGDGSAGGFGAKAATILVGVVAFNEILAPIALRISLVRSGEAGKKRPVDFAATDH